MKFTKGYWMNLPGVTNTDAVQVREVKVENDRVYLYTVPYHADMRAMGGPLLEMYISSPQPDIIRTEAYHFMGSNQKMPAFERGVGVVGKTALCGIEHERVRTAEIRALHAVAHGRDTANVFGACIGFEVIPLDERFHALVCRGARG